MIYFPVTNFFAIANLKKLSWCNVIQQMKKLSPYGGSKIDRNCHLTICQFEAPVNGIDLLRSTQMFTYLPRQNN